ncbi:ATP-dependent Clp protease ATP-binding subunit [bacterium]|nr:ATP-dependent Clp protease ATP-binding subunit [bacterium]
MAIDYGWQNRTILGYHSRDNNSYGVIEKELPILTKELDAMFLVTRNHYFTISTPQISNVITNSLRTAKFENTRRTISNALLIPGLIVALGYMLQFLGVLDDILILKNFFNSSIANLLFGISILSVLALWHDYYKDRSHPIRLPKTEIIPQKEYEEVKTVGFKFNHYSNLDAIKYINDDTLNLVCDNTQKNQFSIHSTFITLLNVPNIKEILKRADIQIDAGELNENKINPETLPTYPATSLRSILLYAVEEALLTESQIVRPEHLFLALTKVFPTLQKFLQANNSSLDILREIVRYNARLRKRNLATNIFNPNVAYYKKGGIAEQWIYGYTFILNHFSTNITEQIAKTRDVFGIGHDLEIEALVSILGKVNNKHALLIGEPGTGKSSLILGVAQRINRGDVPLQIKDKRIIKLDINALIAHASKPGQNMEELIAKAMNELAQAGDVILFIDEMQELMPTKAQESGHSIAGILLPYILDSKFPIVGTVNHSDYKKYFYNNESLRQTFTNIEVAEISLDDALYILETKIEILEKNFGCYITFPALISAVELAQRYIKEKKLPSSAVATIESACSWAQANQIKLLTSEHVAKAISLQKNINITPISAEESTNLMKLEENIKSKVVGQDEAILTIVDALRRARTDIRDPNKPIGTFLFMGPTGVGKTHISKVVCEEFFGEDKKMIRIDMSEYQDIKSIEKFLGSTTPEFGKSSISLIDQIKSNPYTVVLFDEIEKAHPQILDLFLQIFDEGRLTSNSGETVDFTNTIIICTSNIGSLTLLETLQQSNSLWEEAKSKALIELQHSIRPELLNRFDKVIVFQPHSLENLSKITILLLTQLSKRLGKKGYILQWSDQIPMLISDKSNIPGMGARPLKRYIQDQIEGKIAQEILEGNLKSGDEISIKDSWII